ncbi:hypothetical protein [Mesorhizobium sp. B2-6-2]|uniref:hypothetical protein n=1 Tax=Mesorhizobium sp. B2-6-2 TaxID=2589915 RepID=UPI00112845A6|nr:hypothetical protein FJ419_01370 [Mesorhizobium sp. B2-6-2]
MDWRSEHVVHVAAGAVTLQGNLSLPPDALGLVLFAHGSGSSRHSPRNRHVAARLNEANLATFLVDLLTAEEERIHGPTTAADSIYFTALKNLAAETESAGSVAKYSQ